MSPSRHPPKRPKAEIRRLDKTLPRLELAAALEQTGGVDEGHLAKLLRSQGESAGKNISTLARQMNVPYKRLVEIYRDAKRMEGIVAVATRLPKVMEDVAVDAESREVICGACEGVGRIVLKAADDGLSEETKLCILCEGRGKVIQKGDPIARKQVLEMMELVGPKVTPFNISGSNVVVAGGSLEDTLRSAKAGQQQRVEPQTIDGAKVQ